MAFNFGVIIPQATSTSTLHTFYDPSSSQIVKQNQCCISSSQIVIIGYVALVDAIVGIWSFIFAYNKHEKVRLKVEEGKEQTLTK